VRPYCYIPRYDDDCCAAWFLHANLKNKINQIYLIKHIIQIKRFNLCCHFPVRQKIEVKAEEWKWWINKGVLGWGLGLVGIWGLGLGLGLGERTEELDINYAWMCPRISAWFLIPPFNCHSNTLETSVVYRGFRVSLAKVRMAK
jgi:hypothetical protein